VANFPSGTTIGGVEGVSGDDEDLSVEDADAGKRSGGVLERST